MTGWEEKVKLGTGEKLEYERSGTKGFMGETDIDYYSIKDQSGVVQGKVQVSMHIAVKGFRKTITVEQWGSDGKLSLRESWNP